MENKNIPASEAAEFQLRVDPPRWCCLERFSPADRGEFPMAKQPPKTGGRRRQIQHHGGRRWECLAA
jgi:hypothetical protein